MSLGGANKEYFLHGGPKGLVLGPKAPGTDDHLAYRSDDKFWQVHRKTNGREQWRMTSELAQAELDSLIVNNREPLNISALTGEGVYLLSANRLQVLFTVPELLATIFMPLVFRLMGTIKETRTKNGKKVEFKIEERRIKHLVSKIRAPLGVLEVVLRHVPPKVPLTVLRRVGRWVLVHPKAPGSLKQGLYFVVSKEHFGLVWRNKSGTLQYMPATALFQMYERTERNLPFGNLSELANWGPDFKVTGRTWNPNGH